VRVLSEHAVVLNRLAQATDLLKHFVALAIHVLQSVRNLVIFVALRQVELDRTRVHVAVHNAPLL
jgi:hypothetical protein